MKETFERYLQTIYALSQKSPQVRSVEIGQMLGVNRPDVFRALKTLKLCGYIDQKPYGKIALTEKGKIKALQICEAHTVITDFFVETIGLSRPDAEANAYRIEHILSDTAITKILELYSKKKI